MGLFRKAALQHMQSPEQLDQLIQITDPRDWIALLGICGILIAIIIWSIWGTVTINLPGSGILVKPGGYLIVESPIEGQITKITQLNPNDVIKAGQVIAEVSQPLLQLEINSTKKLISALMEERKHDQIAHRHINDQTQSKIVDAQTHLQTLENQLSVTNKIISPYTGSFLAMRTSPGDYIKPGDSVLSMEDAGKEISAIIFLPPTTTNIETIKPGMLTKIFPGVEKNIQNGYLIGRVKNISKFPASPQAMTNILNNDYLVKYFSEKGPPYLVRVELIPDPHTHSGYRWSSSVGKNIDIQSGMLCTALIETTSKPPINFLIPQPRGN